MRDGSGHRPNLTVDWTERRSFEPRSVAWYAIPLQYTTSLHIRQDALELSTPPYRFYNALTGEGLSKAVLGDRLRNWRGAEI
jgi:hypothetical protein